MSTMQTFDMEGSRRLEAVYTTPDVVEQRRIVLNLLAARPGERAIDIGVGPGFLAHEIAAAVGPDGLVSGIDLSESMLALAETRTRAVGSASVELRPGGAERIPYPDGGFDLAVSTQVLEYVADVASALAEIHRVLRPGGRVLLLDTDWDSIVWRSGDDARMRRVLDTWEQHLADPRLPRTLKGSLEQAGFGVTLTRVVPILNVGFDPATYSAGLLDIMAEFVTGRDGLTASEVDSWRADLLSLGDDYFFSLNRYVFCATRNG